jgi:hypothetical protein
MRNGERIIDQTRYRAHEIKREWVQARI